MIFIYLLEIVNIDVNLRLNINMVFLIREVRKFMFEINNNI